MDICLIQEIIDSSSSLATIFQNCPYSILKKWEVITLSPETLICREGEPQEFIYIIIQGYTEIFHIAENGKKYSQVINKAGEFIGELEIFSEQPSVSSVKAVTGLKLLRIKREFFFKWLELDHNFNCYITKYLCERLYNFASKVGKNALYSLKSRLCSYLLSYIKTPVHTEIGDIEIKIDKEKLSDRFAVTSRSINRILQNLKEKGIIEVQANLIIIKDYHRLVAEEKRSRYE